MVKEEYYEIHLHKIRDDGTGWNGMQFTNCKKIYLCLNGEKIDNVFERFKIMIHDGTCKYYEVEEKANKIFDMEYFLNIEINKYEIPVEELYENCFTCINVNFKYKNDYIEDYKIIVEYDNIIN